MRHPLPCRFFPARLFLSHSPTPCRGFGPAPAKRLFFAGSEHFPAPAPIHDQHHSQPATRPFPEPGCRPVRNPVASRCTFISRSPVISRCTALRRGPVFGGCPACFAGWCPLGPVHRGASRGLPGPRLAGRRRGAAFLPGRRQYGGHGRLPVPSSPGGPGRRPTAAGWRGAGDPGGGGKRHPPALARIADRERPAGAARPARTLRAAYAGTHPSGRQSGAVRAVRHPGDAADPVRGTGLSPHDLVHGPAGRDEHLPRHPAGTTGGLSGAAVQRQPAGR